MILNANFVQDAISKKNGRNHLIVDLVPEKTNFIKKPNAWIFLIDASGSMNGTANKSSKGTENIKIEYAKSAIISFLDKLNEKDKVGVVEFSSFANVISELKQLNNKIDLIKNIQTISPSGCTNIETGLITARNLFSVNDLKNYNCKILLLSDGDTNMGKVTPSELSDYTHKYLLDGITVSCLGIGIEYNSYLLNKISTSGGGYLYHIDVLKKLDEIFEKELDLSNNLCAKNVKLEITIPAYLEIEENLNEYDEENVDDKKEIFIGNVSGKRQVVIGFRNNYRTTDATFLIKCTYLDSSNNEFVLSTKKEIKIVDKIDDYKINEELMEYVLSLIADKEVKRAVLEAETLNTTSTQNYFNNTYVTISNVANSYGVYASSLTTSAMNKVKNIENSCSNAMLTNDLDKIKTNYSILSATSRQ